MQEDEIEVCNDDSFANNSCVDDNGDNVTKCELSTSSTVK